MEQSHPDRLLRPMFVGRLLRIMVGVGALGLTAYLGVGRLSVFGVLALGGLGLSLVVSGLIANPGCELSALLNVFLPREKRKHFS